MPSLDNLDALAFLAKYPIDKIVQHDTIEIVNDGDTGQDYYWAKIVTAAVINEYGRAGLVRARWSIDGGATWQALDSRIVYAYTVSTVAGNPGHPASTTARGLDSGISVGCSDQFIYFRTANGKHGNVTNTVSPNYTPVSRTFLIEYWLYERD